MGKREKRQKIKAVSNSVSRRMPFCSGYEDGGMIESRPGFFTVMYALGGIRMEDAAAFRQKMEYFFSLLPLECCYQFVVHNGVVPKESYLRTVLVEPGRVPHADRYNEVILENMDVGHNNVRRKVYFVVGARKKTAEQAAGFFQENEGKIAALFGGVRLARLSLLERLGILYQAFHPGRMDFGEVLDLDGDGKLRLSNLKYLGMTMKDLVAPDGWDTSAKLLNATRINMGRGESCYSRTLFLNGIPKEISSNVIGDLTGVSGNMLFSMVCLPVDREAGFQEASRKVQENTIVTRRMKRETIQDKKNHAVVQISSRKRADEAAYFYEAAQGMLKVAVASEGAVMETCVTITLYAETMEELDRDTELLKLSAAKFACSVKPLDLCQYEGFCTTLPLCNPKVDVSRFLDSRRLAGLSPVSVAASGRGAGVFMGLNSVNDNLIFVDRKSGGNFSGVILGAEHSGKTFQMKREIFGGMLSPDDRVYVAAVTGEYDDFIRRQGGRNVRPERWNPFYMTDGYGLIEGQEKVKTRFLRALLAVSADAGSEAGARRDTETGRGEKTGDEREKDMLYEIGEFLQEAVDFNDWGAVWKFLMERKGQYPVLAEVSAKISEERSRKGFPAGTGQEPQADAGAFSQEQIGNLESQADIGASSQEQAGSMEQWADAENKGRLFLYHAESAKDILMLMDYLWNEMIINRKQGRGSWIFIEAVDGLLENKFCARYLMKYLQQCGAFRTVVTVAVQDAVGLAGNVEQSVALEELAGGCGYVKLLNLGPVERKKLAEVLNLPNALLPYVTNVEPSKGLILTSASNVPFDDNFLGREDPFVELFL